MLVRMARAGDIDTIIALVRAFAEQEGSEEGLEFERDEFARNLFGGRAEAEVMLAETEAGTTTGFALFFSKFNTWTGKPGMWLGELFVRPEFRGMGYGRRLLSEVARLAVERGCGRLEWSVLDSNAPAIAFYRTLGAVALDDRTTFRLEGDGLSRATQL